MARAKRALTIADYEARALAAARRSAMARAKHMTGTLLDVFHPSHTRYGDTPTTQWTHLVDLYHATHTPQGAR